MPIEYTCPHCQTTATVGDQYAGQSGPCRSCGEMLTIPNVFSPAKGSFTDAAAPVKPGGSGGTIVILLAAFGVAAVLVIAILVALILPAVQSARTAARRMTSMNNLKQIGLAMHNYHEVYRAFPANVPDENGTPRMSWRTAVLPFLEQNVLFEQYDANLPWNASANAMVRSATLPVFRSPLSNDPPNHTNYVAVTDGSASIMEDGEFRQMRDIRDGTANTLMIIEATGLNIEWSEPKDITIEQLITMMQAGKVSDAPGGFNALFADGSVRFISLSTDPQTLRSLVTRDGKEIVSSF